MIISYTRLHEILLVFILKIRSEYFFTHIIENFFLCPESASIQFILTWLHFAIIHTAMDIDQFLLTLTLKDIMSHGYRFKVGYSKFFLHLAVQSLIYTLAQIYMSTASRIPLVRLNILPSRAMLEKQIAFIIKKV